MMVKEIQNPGDRLRHNSSRGNSYLSVSVIDVLSRIVDSGSQVWVGTYSMQQVSYLCFRTF